MCHSTNAFFTLRNLPNSILLAKQIESGRRLSLRKQLDGGFERGILLTNNFVQLCRSHSGLLQLLEGPSGFDALMLADVANEEHTVIWVQPIKQGPHLISARKTGFIDKVKVLALWCEF